MTDSVLPAREALGVKLPELRRSHGLTGAALAERLSWLASKISKLETGRQPLTRVDLDDWVRETSGSEEDPAALYAMLGTLEVARAEWQRLLRGGVHHHQGTWSNLEQKTTKFGVFEPVYVPGLLQTAGYAHHRLAQAVAVFGTTNDTDAAVHARLVRQDILYDQRKRFYFILTEATLRYRLCPQPTCSRNWTASSLPPPCRTCGSGSSASIPRTSSPQATGMLDDNRVIVETFSAELTLTQQPELDLHSTVFGAMASAASYDADARNIIAHVMRDLSSLTARNRRLARRFSEMRTYASPRESSRRNLASFGLLLSPSERQHSRASRWPRNSAEVGASAPSRAAAPGRHSPGRHGRVQGMRRGR